MPFSISRKAAEDLEGIWLHTYRNWSLAQADAYLSMLMEGIEFIAANPETGKQITLKRRRYRYLRVQSHLVFWQYNAARKRTAVIRILHAAMDHTRRL
jgi:toxin ParE1/3/4